MLLGDMTFVKDRGARRYLYLVSGLEENVHLTKEPSSDSVIRFYEHSPTCG